jgi:hypothetical protein
LILKLVSGAMSECSYHKYAEPEGWQDEMEESQSVHVLMAVTSVAAASAVNLLLFVGH